MKCNVGKVDRYIRATIGVGLSIYALSTFNVVALIVSMVLMFTVITRWCIPYQLLGINTGCNLKNHYKSITSSVIEGIAVSVVLYLLVLLAYLIWRYITLALL